MKELLKRKIIIKCRDLGIKLDTANEIASCLNGLMLEEKSVPSLSRLEQEVERRTGLNLRRDTRKREYILARQVFYMSARSYGYLLEEIGGHLSLGHATVYHSLKKAQYDFDFYGTRVIFDSIIKDLNKEYGISRILHQNL